MSVVKVIAFMGKMGAGKTEGARYLVDKYGYTRLRFADGLKRMLKEGLGIPDEYIDGNMKNASCEQLCGQTVRHAMITLGTEWGRDLIHPDLWVKALDTQMRSYIYRGHRNFVIDDARFLNEASYINALNRTPGNYTFDARLIKVIRKDRVEVTNEQHRSESEQDAIKADAEIYNDYTLSMYHQSIDDIVSRRFEG